MWAVLWPWPMTIVLLMASKVSFICIRPLPVAAEETAENLFTDNHRIRSSIEISMPHILRVSSVVYWSCCQSNPPDDRSDHVVPGLSLSSLLEIIDLPCREFVMRSSLVTVIGSRSACVASCCWFCELDILVSEFESGPSFKTGHRMLYQSRQRFISVRLQLCTHHVHNISSDPSERYPTSASWCLWCCYGSRTHWGLVRLKGVFIAVPRLMDYIINQILCSLVPDAIVGST
jgi:hypothetical protein